jgi:hypothetical protein
MPSGKNLKNLKRNLQKKFLPEPVVKSLKSFKKF